MFGMAGDGGPMDYLRGRVNNWQAHPFQNIFSTIAGMAGGPMAGFGAQQAFNRWNDNRFNNASSQLYDRSRDLSTLNTNDAMNKPLGNDALNGNNGFSWEGPTGPNTGSGYQGGGSLTGSASAGPYGGGPMPPVSYNGPSMSGQQWMDRSGGYGNIIGQTQGLAPDQPSGFVNDILDSISMGPGLPGSGHMSPTQRRDYRDGLSLNQNVGNYGVSNMMANGQNVIFGSGDPNGLFRHNQRTVGG